MLLYKKLLLMTFGTNLVEYEALLERFWQGKIEGLCPLPLRPPQIPREQPWD